MTSVEPLTRRPPATESAVALTNLGWRALELGEPQQAVQHFRRALRLRPDYARARSGIVEALKARSPLYRRLLTTTFWLARLSPAVQTAIMLIAFLLLRLLKVIVGENPTWAPALAPLSLGLFLSCILLGLASPLFDLLLRIDPVGEKSLDDDQRRGANLLLWSLVAPVPLLLWFAITRNGLGIVACCFLQFAALPASAIYRCVPGWPRWLMIAVNVAVLATIAPLIAGALAANWPDDLRVQWIKYNVFALIIAQLTATILLMIRGRK
ncbi:tetratricopeptide repeat protein [Anatilimnocola floriformis]|uniref:tetratricopeptide repeat protein n=1 Tax=Anatilimnocola floriformis TaxID=2948575 RepID=UPI0020C324C1|nr:tetratricopeptide repeat protein [Anatilimnocola floriformis]